MRSSNRLRPTYALALPLVAAAVLLWLAIFFPILCVVYGAVLSVAFAVWLVTYSQRRARRKQAQMQAAYYAFHGRRIAEAPLWTR